MCDLDALKRIARDQWDDVTVSDIMKTGGPVGRASWTFRDAVAAMEQSDIDLLPIVDGDGAFIGIVTADDIVKLDEILDETGS